MREYLNGALVAVAFLAAPAFAQLHLLTGSPNPKEGPGGFESALYRVGDDGKLVRLAEIVPAGVGTDWIAVSQTLRLAVLHVRKREDPVVVVGLDKAGIVKQCNLPDIGMGLINEWLIDSPTRGPVLAQDRETGIAGQTWGLTLDPAVPCDKSFAVIDTAETVQHLLASGTAGVADVGSSDIMSLILVPKTGKLHAWFPQGVVYFDQDVPVEMYAGMQVPWAHILVSNPDLFAVSITDYGASREQRLLVFRKRDKTWLRVPKVSEKFAVRGFGTFLAITAAQARGAGMTESAGRAEWRTERTGSGPSLMVQMREFGVVYPGRIHLYDAATERVRDIVTNQGDSEVILVEGGTVYYRASDRLYSAVITEAGLGPARLLVAGEAIRDAHWAFFRH